jgi:uncharacterized protein (TIGR02284 family)
VDRQSRAFGGRQRSQCPQKRRRRLCQSEIAEQKKAGWSHHSPPNGGSSVASPLFLAGFGRDANLKRLGMQPMCQRTASEPARIVLELLEFVTSGTAMRTQATIRILNRLIRMCRDGEEICGTCSDVTESAGLRSLLRYRSEEWGRQGDELQALVLLLGGTPAVSSSPSANLLATWLVLRTAVLGKSDAEAIRLWSRVQRKGLERYEFALNGYLPERIRRTVSLHSRRVLDRSEKIGILRGEYELPAHSLRSV